MSTQRRSPRGSRLGRWSGVGLSAAIIGIGMAVAAGAAEAQSGPVGADRLADGVFEFRPFVGAFIPTGEQRELLEDAVHTGAQLSWRVVPGVAFTGTFAWSPSRDRLRAGGETLDVLQYDVGVELRGAGWLDRRTWNFSPFVGLGAGGRTYRYRDLDVDARTNVSGYGAIGGDLAFGNAGRRDVGVRLEARDYVSRFKPLGGTEGSQTRNDIGLAAGLFFRF